MRPGPPAGYGDRLSISMSPRMEAPAINSQPTTDAYTLRRSSYGAQAYEAFGNPTGQSGTTVNLATPCPPRGGQGRHGGAVSPRLATFRYVGALGCYWFDCAHHKPDRTSGLRLLGARYYSPQAGRGRLAGA